MVRLETGRLVIRDHNKDDLHSFHALVSDREVMRFLPEIYCDSMEESEESLRIGIEEAEKEHREKYFFVIIEKGSDQYIGDIGFTVTSKETGHLGYFINKRFWGHGYTTEAARRVLDFAFEEAGLHKVVTGCLKENIGSESVMKKCGMIKEADLAEHVWHEGKWKDRLEYRLLRKEWEIMTAS